MRSINVRYLLTYLLIKPERSLCG